MGEIIDISTRKNITLTLVKENLIERAKKNIALGNSGTLDEVIAEINNAKNEEEAKNNFSLSLSRVRAQYGRSGLEG